MSRTQRIRKLREEFLSGIGVPEKSEFKVDKFQSDAISSVVGGHDTLVVAPTGSGKTYIATEAISAYLSMGTKSAYTTPLKALSNTKYNELGKLFGDRAEVGLLTGDRKIEVDAHVIVATTEIYRNELYRSQQRFGLVVLDEVHFIADAQRGPVWEESIILTPRDTALLMLSASISNAREIADWIEDVRGKPCTIITETTRPVALRYGFLHPDLGVMPLSDEKGKILSEVVQYYGHSGLDSSGTRLRGGPFQRGGASGRGGSRGGGYRGRNRKRTKK